MSAARKKAEYQLKQRLNKCRHPKDILVVAAGGVITAEVAAHTMHMLAQHPVPVRRIAEWDTVMNAAAVTAVKMSVRQLTKAVLAAAKLGFSASDPVITALLAHAGNTQGMDTYLRSLFA